LAHFQRFNNEQVRLELKEPRDGRRRLIGRLSGIDGEVVLLEVDGEVWRVNLNDIAVARLVPQG